MHPCKLNIRRGHDINNHLWCTVAFPHTDGFLVQFSNLQSGIPNREVIEVVSLVFFLPILIKWSLGLMGDSRDHQSLPWRGPRARWCLFWCRQDSGTWPGTRHTRTEIQNSPNMGKLFEEFEASTSDLNIWYWTSMYHCKFVHWTFRFGVWTVTFPSCSSVWYFCSNLLRSSELTVSSNTVSISIFHVLSCLRRQNYLDRRFRSQKENPWD